MASIDFSELSFDGVFLNPMVVPVKKSPADYYPTWKQYAEFLPANFPHLNGVFMNKLLRYIPLVYAQKSPLHTVLSDIKKIKGAAAELAGFKRDEDGNFTKEVFSILQCRDNAVNKMIVRYIMIHKSGKYHEYAILREAHYNLGVRIVEEPDDKDIKNFKGLSIQLDDLSQTILGGDTSHKLHEDMYEYYLEDRLKLRPEDIARNRKEGKELV